MSKNQTPGLCIRLDFPDTHAEMKIPMTVIYQKCFQKKSSMEEEKRNWKRRTLSKEEMSSESPWGRRSNCDSVTQGTLEIVELLATQSVVHTPAGQHH